MSIPLTSAYLCGDCEHLGVNSRNCERCQSRSLLNLASVLNRHTLSHEAREVLKYIPSMAGAR